MSAVNDDDVTNMMEKYKKFSSGDGFTRHRNFFFLHPDQDGSLHYVVGDEREIERRYVDALNFLNKGFDFRKCNSPVMASIVVDIHLTEQFFNSMSKNQCFWYVYRLKKLMVLIGNSVHC